MILCRYEELKNYEPLLDGLGNGTALVEELRKKGFPTGRYDFVGGYLMVQRGETKPFDVCSFETHRKWIDVQILLEGGEKAYYAPFSALEPVNEYSEENDIQFFRTASGWTVIEGEPGMVYVAFPEDGHMPVRIKDEQPASYVKIVMKLPVRQ